jgi:hypothetical protein
MLETIEVMGIEVKNLSIFNILVGEDRNGKEEVLDALRSSSANLVKNVLKKSQKYTLEDLEQTKEYRIIKILHNLYAAKYNMHFISKIDTGVHYTNLQEILTLLIETAIEDGLQFFVTTDSLDLLQAIQDVEKKIGKHISVHRINLPKKMCINYSYPEILRSLELDEEMRGL